MKQKVGKFSALIVLLMVSAIVFAACAGKNANTDAAPSSSAPPSSTAPASETAPAAPAKEAFTFSLNTDNPGITWADEVAVEITKRTGATIKWDIITGDFKEKLNVWLAAGDYPDVVNMPDSTMLQYVQANALVDLTDLIKEHAPNIMAAYNNDLSLLQQADGKIYGLLAPPAQSVQLLNESGWMYIQADVLKEAGYPPMKTLDDVANVVSSYAKNHPEIGGGKTIGFSNFGHDNQLFNIFDTAARSYAGLPITGLYFIDDQKNARLRFFEPGYTDAFKFFNKINKQGLFDPESLVQNQDQFLTKCNQGRVLAVFGPAFAGGCTIDLVKNGMPERSYVAFDFVAPGKTKISVEPQLLSERGGDMWVAITKNAKDPVRLIQFYDDMFKPENQVLLGWGIEGKYYTVDNGKRKVTDWFFEQSQTDPDFYEKLGMVYSRPLMGIIKGGATLSDGDFAKFNYSQDFITRGYNDVQKDTLAKYNVATYTDLLVPSTQIDYQFTAANWTDDMKKFNTEAIAEWGKALQKFVLEKDESKLDSIWQNLEKTLKDKGLDKQNAEVTRLYQEHLATVK